MEREQAIKELKEVREKDDPEFGHPIADNVLCELLKTLGYPDVVEAYQAIDKWYA